MSELVDELADTNARIVVLACIGGSVQAMLHALSRAWEGREDRPIVVTGYVGLVYERVVDGLLLRAGADLVLANSAADARRFREVLGAVDADVDSVVQTALPFLGGPKHDPKAAPRDRPFTTTFVTQPGVPVSRAERRYALLQAIEHARVNPSRRVIVKLRGRPGERTTHVEPHHYASLVRARHLPDNLELAYGSMSEVLDRTDLCVTVSSTAAIEAMHRDDPDRGTDRLRHPRIARKPRVHGIWRAHLVERVARRRDPQARPRDGRRITASTTPLRTRPRPVASPN